MYVLFVHQNLYCTTICVKLTIENPVSLLLRFVSMNTHDWPAETKKAQFTTLSWQNLKILNIDTSTSKRLGHFIYQDKLYRLAPTDPILNLLLQLICFIINNSNTRTFHTCQIIIQIIANLCWMNRCENMVIWQTRVMARRHDWTKFSKEYLPITPHSPVYIITLPLGLHKNQSFVLPLLHDLIQQFD